MSALLVKNPSAELHDWLRNEAHFNRRSLNQQILLCLEWCMHTYGAAQRRDPFAKVKTARAEVPAFVHGEELVRKLMSQTGIDAKTAAQMRRAAKKVRQAKDREFDYACFD